jgi:hypothetical protein
VREAVRAEIDTEGRYRVGSFAAVTLHRLCVQLLEAGYSPDASVECYRSGRPTWDIRARSIGAAAAEARTEAEGAAREVDTPSPKERTSAAPASQSGPCQTPSPVLTAGNLVWDGLRLRLRSSNRELAVLKPDAEYPSLFRVHIAPDHVTDILNLTRARDAAVGLTLAMLNGEVAHKRASRPRRSGAG